MQNFLDSDDQNPKFLDEKYTLVMDEKQQNSIGQNLHILPHSLRAQDGDRSIQAPIIYSFEAPAATSTDPAASAAAAGTAANVVNDLDTSIPFGPQAGSPKDDQLAQPSFANIDKYLHLSRSSGEIRLLRVWPNDWSQGPLTLVVRATQADNEDRYTLTTLTITSSGKSTAAPSSNAAIAKNFQHPGNTRQTGIQFVTSKLNVSVAENTPVFEKIGNVKAILMQSDPATNNSSDSANLNDSVDLISSSSSVAVNTRIPATTPSIRSTSDVTNSWQRQPRNIQKEQQSAKQRLGGRQVQINQHNSQSNSNNNNNKNNQQQANSISYQILDDQTDQFGVNQSGEIFLKKALDYEQRQEFLFRILATHSRYSDICQVQVNVINVNDNKPKVSC